MKITALSAQQKNKNRINVSVDGKYRFSLDIAQIIDLGIKVGNEYSEDEIQKFEGEGQYGLLYARALEYCLVRPRSSREMRDYFIRKRKTRRIRLRKSGEIKEVEGVSESAVQKVYDRLTERGYIDDDKFTMYWLQNRKTKNGMSKRMIKNELMTKGIEESKIDMFLAQSNRNDKEEIKKVINKKQSRYKDSKKLLQYLLRQGFSYDDVLGELGNREQLL